MNQTLKISSLAMLVSIGLTACHGYKDNSPIQEPTVIHKQDNIKKPVQPEKKPAQPEKKPAPPQSTEQHKQPTPQITEKGKGVTSNDLPEVHFQNGKGVTTEALPEAHFQNGKGVTANDLPEGKLPEPEKIISLDSQGVQWRVVSLSGYPANNTDKVNYTYDDFEKANHLTDNTLKYFSHSCNDSGHCKGNVLTNRQQGSNGEIELNLDELAQKDGKPLLGFHKGEFYDKDLYGDDSIKGSTTYKGNVIASTTTENNLPHFSRIRTEPKLDGTVTLNANFGESWDRTYVSGEIDSQTIGKFKLPRTAISDNLSTRYQGNIYKAMRDGVPLEGDYHVKFGGKDLNDAVGRVDLFRYRNENGAVNRYNAVFGATKQPK